MGKLVRGSTLRDYISLKIQVSYMRIGFAERLSDYILNKRDEIFMKKLGGRTVSYEEAEQAYRDGKIVNLVKYCPEIFGDEGKDY